VDRVRPLDGAGRTFLAYFPGTGSAAVVKSLTGDEARVAANAWSGLAASPSLVGALGLLPGGEGVVYEYVAPDAYSRKAQMRSAFERRLRRDPLAFPEVLRLAVLACRGLEHSYAGGVRGHGNLKPSNLLVGLDGGLRVSEPGLPGSESPGHMAPERFDGAPADGPSDVYSLGIILYQMAAAGRLPFETPSTGPGLENELRYRDDLRQLHLEGLVPRLDSPLAAILEQCLAKAPAARVGLSVLRAELEDLLRRETGLLPALTGKAELAGWERAQQGLALLATGRAEPALAAFDQALLALPPCASVRSVRATALHVAGRHEEAVASADAALAVDPQHAPAWQQKGLSLAALQRSDEAASALEQATLLAPRDASPFVALAGLLGRLGRLPQSLAAYDRAVAADPDYVDVWFERGKTLGTAGLRADAAGALLRFLDLAHVSHPARPKAEDLLREAREGGDAPPAVEHSPVTELAPPPAPLPEAGTGGELPEPSAPQEPEPVDAAAWSARGVSLFRAGRLEEALAALDRAIVGDKRNPSHWANRASVLFRLARPEEGLAGHVRALSLEPRLATSWLNKAAIERSLGRSADAARSLLELLELDPPADARLLEQAQALLAEIRLQGIEAAPRGALGFLAAGLREAEAGRLEPAAVAFESALERDPLLPLAWLYRGDALAQVGRVAEAATAYEEGLSADPSDVRLLLGYGRSRARLGQLDAAAAVLSRCLEIATGDERAAAERLLQAVVARQGATRDPEPPAPEPEAASPITPEDASEPVAPEAPPAEEPAPAAEPSPPAPEDLIARGESLAQLGRWTEAIDQYEMALQLDPRRRDAWMGRGLGLAGLARHGDAITSFVKVLQVDPGDVAALLAKASSERAAGRIEEALRSFERLLVVAPAEDPRREEAQAALSTFRESSSPKPPVPVPVPAPPAPVTVPAEEVPASATPAPTAAPAPSSPVPVETDPVAAATALLGKGHAAEAFEILDQATNAGHDEARVWMARGDSLRALGRKEEAAASFDEALKRAPGDPQAWVKKAEILDAAGAYAEAAACYERAVDLHPRHIGAWNSRGVALTRVGRMEDALGCFVHALELDPRFALARFNRGAAEDVLGRGDDARVSFESFLAVAPPNLRPQIQHAQKRLAALKAPRG
jgi:tetratricopeptide (TPR) repeat protein